MLNMILRHTLNFNKMCEQIQKKITVKSKEQEEITGITPSHSTNI